MKIHPPHKVYVSKSPIHGYGVFANERIYEGEVIEETPLLDLEIPQGESTSLMIDYRFNWPQGSGGNWEKQVLPWGYGCIYNHSNEANAFWRSNLEKQTFEFVANRVIDKDEEICTYYGGVSYWEDGRTNTEVK
jgi:tRNA-specific adenosine deaminase 3